MTNTGAASGRREVLSYQEVWKAQLAYVSGTIVAWGAVLLKLWPVLSGMQTGTHVVSLGRDPGEGTATSYYLLALLVSVGVGMLIFGATHLVARGFWLGTSLLDTEDERDGRSERLADAAYLVLHVFWATAVVFLVLVLLSALAALIAGGLGSRLGWPMGITRTIAGILVFGLAIGLVIWRYGVRGADGRRQLVDRSRRLGARILGVAYLSLPLIWFAVIEFSYRANIALDRHVISRRADSSIVVSVELGGAVSDPAPAVVTIARDSAVAPADTLALLPVDRGHYVALVATQSLARGAHLVRMAYPHRALTSAFPFVRQTLIRTVRVVVVD